MIHSHHIDNNARTRRWNVNSALRRICSRCGRVLGYLCIIALANSVMCAQNHFKSVRLDSLYFTVGAIRFVPCNDGTIVGGALYCNRTSDNGNISFRQPCDEIFLNRSYDGGVTWVPERVSAPAHSGGLIVRMKDGVLVAPDATMYHAFMRSSDHGRSWQRHIISASSYGPHPMGMAVGDNLMRDDRGTLLWYDSYDRIALSIDEGVTQSGIIPDVEYTSSQGNMRESMRFTNNGAFVWSHHATADYGRTWIEFNYHVIPRTPSEIQRIDGRSFNWINDAFVQRDTLFLSLSGRCDTCPDDNEYTSKYPATDFFVFADPKLRKFSFDPKILPRKQIFKKSSAENSIVDSLGRHHASGTMGSLDNGGWFPWEYRFADGTVDTAKPIERGDWREFLSISTFYDLDGNLHTNSRASFRHADHIRPVSMLDRLHTCGGMQFLFGGKAIRGVEVVEQFTKNANVAWSVSANRRVVFIDVKAIDSTLPVRVCFTVSDSLRPGMTHCDSTNLPTTRPRIDSVLYLGSGTWGNSFLLRSELYDGWMSWDRVGRNPKEGTSGSPRSIFYGEGDVFVRSRDRNGCIRCSDTVSLRVVSVDEQSGYGSRDTSLTLALAPNPASGEVTMEFSTGRLGGAPYRIEVVDMLGTVVYTNESTMVGGVTNVATFSVAALPRGAYVVRIVARGSVASQVLLVQ